MGQRSSSSPKQKQLEVKSPISEKKEETIIIDDEITFPILAVGDSITKGYYGRGRKFHPYASKLNQLILNARRVVGVKVYEFGLSGETTDKMKERLKRLIDKKPNIDDQVTHFIGDQYDDISESQVGPMHIPKIGFKGAIVIGGTNDLAYGFSSEKIANNLIEMVEYCWKRNVEWVVTCSIPSSQYDADDSPSLTKILEKKANVNERVKEYVAQQQELGRNIIFVDFMTELNYCTCSEEDKKLWDDSLHFTPAGSDRIADILFQQMSLVNLSYE